MVYVKNYKSKITSSKQIPSTNIRNTKQYDLEDMVVK